jgi:hypothetical protein
VVRGHLVAPERRAAAVVSRQVDLLTHLVDDSLGVSRITRDNPLRPKQHLSGQE